MADSWMTLLTTSTAEACSRTVVQWWRRVLRSGTQSVAALITAASLRFLLKVALQTR